MDDFELTLRRFGTWLSRLLDPAMDQLDQLNLSIRHYLQLVGVPGRWHAAILTAAMVLVVLIVVRTLTGWLRLLVLVLAALVLAKAYGVLPHG